MEATCVSGWVRWLGRVPHKAVASAAVALAVVACGGGGGSAPVAGAPSGQRLVATPAAAVGTIADRYTVVNLDSHGWAYYGQWRQPINASGQVAYQAWDPPTGRYLAMRFDGTASHDVSPATADWDFQLSGVNDAGEVFGTACCANGNSQPFVWRSGAAQLAPSGVAPGYLYGFNNAGQAAVYGYADSKPRIWTVATGTVVTGSQFPGWAVPIGINESGVTVGVGDRSSGAFVWTPGASPTEVQWLTMPTGSTYEGVPYQVNASGQVAGYYYDGYARIFRWTPGDTAASPLNVPRTGQSWLYDQNDAGQIVGYSAHPDWSGYAVGFVWTPASGGSGNAIELSLGGHWSVATGINHAGLVVGYGARATGQQSAFAWSSSQGVVDLNTRIPEAAALGTYLYEATAVSDNGSILAHGTTGLVLLVPGSVATPTVGPISANDPVAVNTALAFSVGFSDADTSDTHTALWSWGDGTADTAASINEANGTGTASASHTFAAAGVYTVTVAVTDNTGRSATGSREVVAYDPTAGFVTGGGWIESPPGAYKENTTLAGRANFGFVSKYQKGATRPSGNTQFQFHAASLNFHSDTYDWLVVAGARAQYKGVGTINGQGEYRFLLTAVDGAKLGGATPDRFRIKIWQYDSATEQDVVVYDNQLDSGTEGGNSEGTAIAGGSIVIHSK